MALDRRTLVRASLAAAATGLAGCTDGEGTPTEGGAQSPTASRTPATTPLSEPVVEVAPGGNLRFRPESFRIRPGTTVTWVWRGSGHNVVVESQPAGASWEGTPGGENETYDEGYEYSHTFEVAGTYDYYCAPHRQFGMTASLTVVEE